MTKFHKKRLKITFILIITICIFTFYTAAVCFKKYMLPSAVKLSSNYAVTAINGSINQTINEIVESQGLTAEDFFVQTADSNGKLNSLTVNSLLINSLCGEAAEKISADLNEMSLKPIALPLGSITGTALIANKGPKIHIHISNKGNTTADYDTEFIAQGINQINYKVWLTVRCEVGVYIPFYESELVVNRKIMLVNTVFSGDVPLLYAGD